MNESLSRFADRNCIAQGERAPTGYGTASVYISGDIEGNRHSDHLVKDCAGLDES